MLQCFPGGAVGVCGCPVNDCDLGPVTSLNSDLGGRCSLKSKPYLFYFKVYFDANVLGSDMEICSVNWPSLFFLFGCL